MKPAQGARPEREESGPTKRPEDTAEVLQGETGNEKRESWSEMLMFGLLHCWLELVARWIPKHKLVPMPGNEPNKQ